MQVFFNDEDEFLKELELDRDLIERDIFRATFRRIYRDDALQCSVVSTVRLKDTTVIRLNAWLGTCSRHDQVSSEQLKARGEALLARLTKSARGLQLSIRKGVYE